MKKLVLATIFIFSLFISCTKDVGEQVDQIVYKDVNPDLRLKTIREFEPDPHYACPPFLIPRDSSVNYELDLDEDSEIDYKINVRHFTYTYTYESGYAKCLSHCNVYSNRQISISPVSSTAFICSIQNEYQSQIPPPRNFYETERITKDDIWIQKESYVLLDGCGPPPMNAFKTPYWGLYFNGQLAWIKMEQTDSNGVKVLEWGYNKTKGKGIKAGQKN